MAFVRLRDPSIRFPYKVTKRSIGNYSILFLKNKHKEWTKALKYALTNLKWLLMWVSARGYSIATSDAAVLTPAAALTTVAASSTPTTASATGSAVVRSSSAKQSVIVTEHFS